MVGNFVSRRLASISEKRIVDDAYPGTRPECCFLGLIYSQYPSRRAGFIRSDRD